MAQTLSKGSLETDCSVCETVFKKMRLFTIDVQQNNHFGSHDMAVLY